MNDSHPNHNDITADLIVSTRWMSNAAACLHVIQTEYVRSWFLLSIML